MISTELLTRILCRFQVMVPECNLHVAPEALAGYITAELLKETSRHPGLGPIELMNAVSAIEHRLDDSKHVFEISSDGKSFVLMLWNNNGDVIEEVHGTHETVPLSDALIRLGQRLARKL